MRYRCPLASDLHRSQSRESFRKKKMKWLLACVIGAFALYMAIDQGVAIKCYVCNSYFQKTCSDWFDNRTYNLEQCDPGVTMCRKIVQEVYYNDDWQTRYIRQCAPSGEVGADEGRQCAERTGTYRVKMRYCHCNNQDGCNGADSVKIPMIMMLIPAFTTLGLLLKRV